MTYAKTFEELDKLAHDRTSFDCGETELNIFITTQALQHKKAGISRTMVLPTLLPLANKKYSICAFYCATTSTIYRESLPASLAKKLPHYPVPVFLIAQLAVDKNYHGNGLGKITLIKALQYLWQVNQYMPAYAIIVDCLTSSAEKFYAKFGFELLCVHNNRTRLFLPMKTVEQLFSGKS